MRVGIAISVSLCIFIKELENVEGIFMKCCIGEFYIKTIVSKYKCLLKSGNSNEPIRFSAYFERKLRNIYRSEKRVEGKNKTPFSYNACFPYVKF
jgi:hypothetical protein